MHETSNPDKSKGAIEPENRGDANDTSQSGQLGHRDQEPMLKDADSDFPEPGESPEHSGEPTGRTRPKEAKA
jgi:hypothetical protein